MMYRLIVLSGPLMGQRFNVEQEPMVVGRAASCTVALPDEEVAKEHAVIEHRHGGLFIRDLGSMNRMLVNNHEVREAFLKHGDEIELGRTRLLVHAVVQAEVDPFRRRSRRRGLAFAAVLLLAAGAFLAYSRGYLEPVVSAAASILAWRRGAEGVAVSLPVEAPAGADASVVSNELRRMRSEIGNIRAVVEGLHTARTAVAGLESDAASTAMAVRAAGSATNAAVASSGAASASLPEGVDPGELGRMLSEARGEAEAGNLDAADVLLATLETLAPDFVPVYRERAALFERRGMAEKAALYRALVAEHENGKRRPAADTNAVVHAAPPAATSAMPTRLIRIVAVEQQRFQSSDDYDEMRVLNIRLLPLQGAVSLRPDLVDVIVDFFDEDTATRRVGKARAIVPPSVVRPSGPWVDGEEKAVMASYVVPRGARAREAALGRHEQFHGYVVSVVCRGVTNDIDARPRTLAPLLPSTGAGTESADVSLHRGEGPLRTTER